LIRRRVKSSNESDVAYWFVFQTKPAVSSIKSLAITPSRQKKVVSREEPPKRTA
jgi:hypothetical protein